jgi:hypothetical protein
MKTIALGAAFALAAAAPALAQEHEDHALASPTAPAGKISVETTRISDLITNPKAKAALEAALPQITQFYDQIGNMTLSQVAPMSQGALDDAKLKELQAKFDEIN